MILGIATVVVLVLGRTCDLLPAKKRDQRRHRPRTSFSPFTRPANFRQQQLSEEAEAIADEYQRRADEAWREELGRESRNRLVSDQNDDGITKTT